MENITTDILRLKNILAVKIAGLIEEFETETKATVTDIEIESIDTSSKCGPSRVISNLTIKIS